MFDLIPPVGFPCPVPVLPSVFDDSLSYYELLAKLWQQCKELTDMVNAETVEINRLREKINEILPYIDQLATLSEELQAIRDSITALSDRLYDPTDGDITEIRATLSALSDALNAMRAKLNSAYNGMLQNRVAAATNVLRETWHMLTTTVRGVLIEYSEATGWFHLTGTVLAPTTPGTRTTVELARYSIKEPYRTMLTAVGRFPDYNGFVRLWSDGFVSADTKERYAGLLAFVVGSTEENFDGMNATYPATIGNTDLSIKVILPASAVAVSLDIWITPSMAFVPLTYDDQNAEYYIPPTNGETPAELKNRIIAEAAARIEADNAEATARQTAVNSLSERLTAEIEMRLSEDQQLAEEISAERSARTVAISAEATARQDADEGLQEQIDRRYTLGLGQILTDPDPSNGVYADLFTLPVGKYYRSTNPTLVQNLPPGFNGGFVCVVDAGIAGSRPMITLWKVSGANADASEFFRNLKTASGYGTWYRYGGTAVVPD